MNPSSSDHFYSFASYLKKHYSYPVYKATVDAGFICPNMDGTKSVGGCTFCNNASFSPAFVVRKEDVLTQIETNIQRFALQRKKLALRNPHFIAYFQAFSGTYGSVDILKEWYAQALSHPKVIGLSVGTRCDCLPDDVLELFEQLASQHKEIWLEIGVETTHDKTLQLVNRGHTFKEVEDALYKIKQIPNLKVCLHLIHGLPNESTEMMLESVRKVNRLKPDAVKFHHLEIIKDTVMEKQYNNKEISVLSKDEYFDLLGKSLQIVDKNIIIQRLFSFSPEEYLVAPHWYQQSVWQEFYSYLEKNNIYQGKA